MRAGEGNSGGSRAGDKWFKACGIGCLAFLLLLIVAAGSCFVFVRRTTAPFDAAVEAEQQLSERLGASDDFTPWPDGAVPAERMQAFLAVREATQPAREALARTFGKLPLDERGAQDLEQQPKGQQLRSVLSIMRSAFGLGGDIGRFFEARNLALLDRGMGHEEYLYIYLVAYAEQAVQGTEHAPLQLEGGEHHDEALTLLRRQRDALPEGEWRAQLAAEIEALEADPSRYPWAEGLPAQIAASVAPYRARLDETYEPLARAFEMGRVERHGRFSYSTD